jgi:diguanylate cyclase (GGDEF)-like protein
MDTDRLTTSAANRRTTQRYLGLIVLLISLVVASSFLGFTYRTNALFDTLMLEEARAFQKEITQVRRWVRESGGVYVRRGDINADPKSIVIDQDGEVLQRRNTSEVTQELSHLSHQAGIVQFGSISLAPLNPLNQPDDFERSGLARLRNGEAEIYGYGVIDGRLVFRYMSPLITHWKCLDCHSDGSFQAGRVDSALTFRIPAGAIDMEKHRNRVWMALSGTGVIGLVSLSIWLLSRRFVHQLVDADQRLEKLAAEDALTHLFNRRMGMELLKTELTRCKRKDQFLSVALLDIDHFKRINDKMGHLVGDEALQAMADLIRRQLREYDNVFRYGGEEFVLVMPDTSASQAMKIAERLRATVEDSKITTSHHEPLDITVSIGVEQFQAGMDLDTLLIHADKALYDAKESGRNCCVLYSA